MASSTDFRKALYKNRFPDNAALNFGDAKDVSASWDGTDLDVLPLATNSVINIGNGTLSCDVKTFGSAAANYTLWDASDNAIEFAGAARLDFAGLTTSTATNGSMLTTGSTWIDNSAAGGTVFKILASTSATSGDFATMRPRARAGAAGNAKCVNASASAAANDYGDLCAVEGYAQPLTYTQAGASNIVCGVYSCIDATASSSGRRWSTWVDTHATTKASASDYLLRASHNGTIAIDGLMTVYGGGRLPVFCNVEDATPGFFAATPGTYSTADAVVTWKVNGTTYYQPLFLAAD